MTKSADYPARCPSTIRGLRITRKKQIGQPPDTAHAIYTHQTSLRETPFFLSRAHHGGDIDLHIEGASAVASSPAFRCEVCEVSDGQERSVNRRLFLTKCSVFSPLTEDKTMQMYLFFSVRQRDKNKNLHFWPK